MSKAYLFVHFREKTTPDGEQVYFGLSKDAYKWEEVNNGNPVLWAYYGDKGVRDHTIIKCKHNNKYYIIATDLSLAYGMRGKYGNSWEKIGRNGRKDFAIWESEDLVNWSEQRLIKIGGETFECMWAPDVIYDEKNKEYVLHFSASYKDNDYTDKAIFYSRTRDFKTFSKPEILMKADGDIIDSAIYEENNKYFLFIKHTRNPGRIQLYKADDVCGRYEKIEAFDNSMELIEEGKYEAPTAVRMDDGRWCLFLDYYGVPGKGQGYVPFVANSLESGAFKRADKEFLFPYGYKHGTIIEISLDEYERIKNHDWSDQGWR